MDSAVSGRRNFACPLTFSNEARNALERVRRLIVLKCAEIASLREQHEAEKLLAIVLFVAAIILLVAAAVAAFIPFAGQGFAGALAAAGALLLGLAVWAGLKAADTQNKIATKQGELGTLRAQFLDEVNNVGENCCVQCIFNDLTLPDCG